MASEGHDPNNDHRENFTSNTVQYLLTVEGMLPKLRITKTP